MRYKEEVVRILGVLYEIRSDLENGHVIVAWQEISRNIDMIEMGIENGNDSN